MDVRGAAIGGYHHHFTPLVARLGREVVAANHGVDGVGVGVHDELGVEQVVEAAGRVELAEGEVDARREVVDDGVHIESQRTDELHNALEGEAGQHASLPRSSFLDHRLRTHLLDSIQHMVGDLGQGLIPGDLLPLPLTPLAGPLEGVQHSLRRVQHPAPGGPFLAPHGVQVWDALLNDGECAGLLLIEDHPVLHVDAVRTVARIAVHAVGGNKRLVPLPALSVEILSSFVFTTGGPFTFLERLQGERRREHQTLPSSVQHQATT